MDGTLDVIVRTKVVQTFPLTHSPELVELKINCFQGAPAALWEQYYEGTQSVLEVVNDYCNNFGLSSADCQLYLEGKLLPKDRFLGQVRHDARMPKQYQHLTISTS